MNKKLAVVLAALMMLSTTTFLANPSGSTTNDSLTPGYTAVEVYDADLANAAAATVEATVEADEEVVFVSVKEVTGKPGEAVTVAVAGVSKGDKVVVLHWDGAKWESDSVSNVVVGDGTVTATFAKLSPVAYVKVAEAEAPAVPYNGAHFATQLPKTGVVAVLPVAAMACLAGAVVCGRKEK